MTIEDELKEIKSLISQINQKLDFLVQDDGKFDGYSLKDIKQKPDS